MELEATPKKERNGFDAAALKVESDDTNTKHYVVGSDSRPAVIVTRDVATERVTIECSRTVAVTCVVWAILVTCAVVWLFALKVHHFSKLKEHHEDNLEQLEEVVIKQAEVASKKIRKIPVLSTLYVFGAHYVAPYVWVAGSLIRPYVAGFFAYVVPLLRRLSPTWIFLQWGMHAREIRIHTKAVARLNNLGSDIMRAGKAGTKAMGFGRRGPGLPPVPKR